MAITLQDIKRVKGQGFLHNRGTEQFSGRVITQNGVLTAKQMKNLSEAAEKFGNGTLAFTSRLTVELPGISYENMEGFQKHIAQEDMLTGGTGAKVRPVVSCKGTTCVFGLYDTQALAKEVHVRFYEGYHDVTLPHKFKIGIGGCPNNCIKPDLNDIGIVGQRVPKVELELCKRCKVCQVEKACPMHAAVLGSDAISIDSGICNHCGRCAGTCPFQAVTHGETMYKVYIGGRWGKQVRIGSALTKLFTKDEVLDVIEKAILLFKSKGIAGERFGTTIDRIGVEEAEEMLISNHLLKEKGAVLEG
ncbi:4Fe-4S binding protein [Hydrogenoanaerobacterium sp.]|uniref:4Fe-4S binding protein n=1 Tax=Hydrogenoanaerobacterium sp. TaxID=2953763 RepID=UPI00289EE2DA|nr:4Fe-4S binding protein [Hydrogenoanaerobacterium sp.]